MSRRSWVFAAAVAAQLVVLYAPRAPSAGGGVPGLDKAVHVAAFAVVMAAGLRSPAPRWVVLLLTVVHAPVSELTQATVLPGRSGEAADVAADLLGCLLGWWAINRDRMHR